ncbi:MAG: sialate O-acetylesterase, partial [Almyronema sp.]
QVDQVSAEEKPPGVGPGIAFAKELLVYDPDLAIGLIPCAKGGSTIAEWQRNLAEDTLYGACLKHVRAASVMGTVEGVLFFQGEADAIAPERLPGRSVYPQQWAALFEQYVRDLRQDLDQPDLPLVFAQIATTTRLDILPNWEQVKAQQVTVNIPAVAMIKTDDLALQDYVHFTSESYEVIGQRFAQAYWQLTRQD